MENQKLTRIHSLDYLRGISAFGVMIYHMHLFNYGEVSADHFLSKVKIFAVAIFYVLSGLTLYKVYENKLKFTWHSIKQFFYKRFLRIFPLLWLVMLATIAITGINPGLKKLFLNITGLFSIVSPQSYIGVGVWSIGNELAFYLLFPVILFALKNGYKSFLLIFTPIIAFYIYYTFYLLDPKLTLPSQWIRYVNPLNQVLLFASGALLGKNLLLEKFKKYSGYVFLLAMTAFILYPVSGDSIQLVVGFNRVFLTLNIFILVYSFVVTDFSFLPEAITSIFRVLGEISYSLYLIHPLALLRFQKMNGGFFEFSVPFIIILTMVVSVIFSYFSYTYFEIPITKLSLVKSRYKGLRDAGVKFGI